MGNRKYQALGAGIWCSKVDVGTGFEGECESLATAMYAGKPYCTRHDPAHTAELNAAKRQRAREEYAAVCEELAKQHATEEGDVIAYLKSTGEFAQVLARVRARAKGGE